MLKGQKHLIITFSFFLGWLLSSIYNGSSLNILIDMQKYPAEILLIALMIVPSILIIILANFMPDESYRKYFFQVSLIGSFLGMIILLYIGNKPNSPLNYIVILLTLVCLGLSALFYVVGSTSYFSYDVPFNDMMRSMSIIIICANLIVYINDVLLNHNFYLISNIFLFGCLIASFVFAKKLHFSGNKERTMFHKNLPKKPIIILCLIIFLYNIGGGVVFDAIEPLINSHSSHAVYWNIFPYIITAVIMIFALKQSNCKEIFLSLASGLIISGFILLALVSKYILIPNIMILSGYAILDIFIWSLVGQIGYVYREPFKVCSLAMASNVLSVVLGSIGSKLLINNSSSPIIIATFISAFCAILAITILPLLSKITLNALHEAIEYIESKEYEQSQNMIYQRFELLTDRELEVTKYLLLGYKNKDIAKKLFISDSTLKTHARNIYSKLEVKNKRELQTMGVELNLLREDLLADVKIV